VRLVAPESGHRNHSFPGVRILWLLRAVPAKCPGAKLDRNQQFSRQCRSTEDENRFEALRSRTLLVGPQKPLTPAVVLPVACFRPGRSRPLLHCSRKFFDKQWDSTSALAAKHDQHLTDFWGALLDDPDKDIACLSLRALALVGPNRPNRLPKPKIVERLRDPCPVTRRMAAFAIGAMGTAGRDVIPLVACMLKDEDRGVQMNAMLALGRLSADSEAQWTVAPKDF
jgi:hypothetical protein